ncbi:ATP synthase F0F1 subunit alpha [Bacillus thuringiensis]|uniref:ATP synthase F0F1 subunit alpha n=1 Tax=Bacillus thuringiensis TaxID=1428 RepID=UPI000BA20E35|nr:ATP synthase F0F1 subunit alpha [Bacillus thuringiensis]
MKKVILAGALGIAALAGTNLPGLEATKASAAVESNIQSIEGRVLKVEANSFEIEAKGFNENMDNPNRLTVNTTQLNPNVKVGDIIKVTGSIWRSFGDSMVPESVVKINNNHILNHQVNGYVTGEIKEIGKRFNDSINYVMVPYINEYGQEEDIEVRLTQGQKFKLGDQVKINIESAFGRGNLNAGTTVTDNIELLKNNDTLEPGVYFEQNGKMDYVVGKVISVNRDTSTPAYPDNVLRVQYPNSKGENESVFVYLSDGFVEQYLSKEEKFHVGDIVKVNNMSNLEKSPLGGTPYIYDTMVNIIEPQNTDNEGKWMFSND